MTETYWIIIIAVAVIVTAAVSILIVRGTMGQRLAQAQTLREAAEQRLVEIRREAEQRLAELKDNAEQRLQEEKEENKAGMELLRAEHQRQLEQMRSEHQNQMESQREQLTQQFDLFRDQLRAETQEVLWKRQKELEQENADQMDNIVRPLHENLEKMQKALQESRVDAATKSARFEEQLRAMIERTVSLGDSANALTQAMKSNGKVQGDWGEQILETILENSGLKRGINYEIQQSTSVGEGHSMRPDVIVHCPGGMRDIVIDSKVSLTAYSNYVTASDAATATQYEKENYDSVKKHVDELARKDYGKLDEKNLSQVLMFVPNEGSYILALRHDPALGQWAFNRGVVILTPTNLMLTLELVSALWVNEKKEKNVEQILATANTLYEKFCAFTGDMEAMQSALNKAQAAYDEAARHLSIGPANVFRQIDNLKSLGIKYNKTKTLRELTSES